MSTPRDRRIIALAAEVSETKDRKAPDLLLCLKGILESAPSGTADGLRLRKEIWNYNLVDVLILNLKQDFSVIDGEWFIACRLAHILCQTLLGLELPKKEKAILKDEKLPVAIESFFICARRIQARYTQMGIDRKDRDELLRNFKDMLDAMTKLATGYSFLAPIVVKSQWLLQLLVTDDAVTVVNTLDLIKGMIRANTGMFYDMEESVIHIIIDELIYKLTVNNDQTIAGAAIKCIIKVCDLYRPAVKLLSDRYKGLRPLMVKWRSRGFDKELRELYLMLDTGTVRLGATAKSQRETDAAEVIQSHWKGFRSRTKLSNANKAFRKFQLKYRDRREKLSKTRIHEQYLSELEHQMALHRQRISRQFKEKQLHIIEIIPADKVETYLAKEKTDAATKIQKVYKGHQTRKHIGKKKTSVSRMRAAITIQRTVRRWIERINKRKKEDPKYLQAPGLDDERRTELMQDIIEWREANPARHTAQDSLKKIHLQSAELLGRFYISLKAQRVREQQRETLMARVETDSELLMLAPKLADATDNEVKMYSSHSVPVAMKAKSCHVEELKKQQLPWWKLLDDRYQDNVYEEEDYLIF